MRRRRPAAPSEGEYAAIARALEEGPHPLAGGAREAAGAAALSVAVVIPWFFPGSGGHQTIVNLVRRLEDRGHSCSLWVHDPTGRHARGDVGKVLRELFGPLRGPVRRGFADWAGADVCLATGWQTVHPVLMLDGCRARAYLVQDHEPDFHPAASAEAVWAGSTYRLGLHCITAGTWLAGLMRERYGASASSFDLAVDHDLYAPRDVPRAHDQVLFYARASTPRRAVPLGLLALAELRRRRPGTEIVLYGDRTPPEAPFPFRHLGVLDARGLADAYSRATVGMALSMTNYSLIAQEMLACGLPCVELDGPSARAAFGAEPPLELAPFDPHALADALERLLADAALRERRSRDGIAFVAPRTGDAAAAQAEDGLREALRRAA